MAGLFALLGLALAIVLLIIFFFFMRSLGRKMERDLAELKERAAEGTAQVAEHYRQKIPPTQAEEFGLTGDEDRKWVAYALFRSRMPQHPAGSDDLVGQVLRLVTYMLAISSSLLLVLGIFVLLAGRYEAGAFFCLISLVGLGTMVLMSDFRKQGVMFKEEREALERVYTQFGDAASEQEA